MLLLRCGRGADTPESRPSGNNVTERAKSDDGAASLASAGRRRHVIQRITAVRSQRARDRNRKSVMAIPEIAMSSARRPLIGR